MSTYGSLIVGWRLHERHVVVVGGNQIAANRVEFALDAQPAKVTLICPRAKLSAKRLSKLVSSGIVCHVDREFAENDLDDGTTGLVLTAVNDTELSERIASAARKRHIPINVAEIPRLCDFLFMPTYKDRHVQVAISTNTSVVGGVPLIANKLRQRIIDSLPDSEAVTSAVSNVAVLKANLGNNSVEELTKITESMEFEKLASLSEGKIRELVSTRAPTSGHDTDDASVSSGSTVALGETDGKLLKSNIEDILVVPDGVELNAGGVRLVDGKTAVAYIAYAVSDSIFVYPTTRSHYLGEATERWASRNVRNLSGHVGQVMRMETRSNAVAALTGAISARTIEGSRQLVGSALATSQSIIAMAPALYMASQARIPMSVHIAAYGNDDEMTEVADYQGVFDLREMGVSIVCSHSAQEAHDLALVCHLASIASQSPFLHAFDGVRTANEFTKVKMLSYSDIARILKDCQNSSSIKSASLTDVFENIADKVGKVTGRKYRPFEYVGAKDAESLLVTFGGEVGIVRDTIERLCRAGDKVGMVIIKVLRPWSDEHFLAVVPKSVKRIAVLEPVHHMTDTHASPLFSDVVASYRAASGPAKSRPLLVNAAYLSSMHFNARTVVSILHQLASGGIVDYSDEPPSSLPVVSSNFKQAIFWDAEATGTVQTAQHVAEVLARDATLNVASFSSYDLYDNGGVANTLLRCGTDSLASSFDEMSGTDYIMIHDVSLTAKYDTLASAKEGTIVLLNTNFTIDDLETKLDNDFRYEAAKRNIRLYIIDTNSVLEQLSASQEARNMVLQAAFLRLHGGVKLDKGKVYDVAAQYDSLGVQDITRVVREVFDQTENALTHVEIPPTWLILEKTDKVLPKTIKCNSLGPNLDFPVTEKPNVGTWHTAARHLLFKEAYGLEEKTRPDLPEETFVIHVSENRQLTPPTYDRYLFHIEFDTTGTDLKYDLGEALGVHGHNDTDEVNEFLAHYGVDPDKVISISSKDGTKFESRTAFQIFSQMLDVFGRPAKRFYEALAQYATDENEKNKLLWLVTSEGAAEFKKRVEDTITYAEILYEFTSARPPVEDLVRMIAPIKPRHYSIASAQSVHPNSVHLLVVTVDWKTSIGKTRFGQCTRYLKYLNVGDKVTVSIKPSVMKLPPRDEQPVIMAGLGTGMAPFRAFIEERAHRKSQGVNVGPMVLYFGSRHRSMEYLYGEELEAYHTEGLLTYLRLAFSRDQKHKVYIQHKMKEDSKLLHQYLLENEGWFYLCGPTWPVPDVKDAIVNSFVTTGGMSEGEASGWVDKLKDLERYILEVY